jgi:hypothetical protein
VSESRGHCQWRLSFIDQTADRASVETTYVAAPHGAAIRGGIGGFLICILIGYWDFNLALM